MQPEVNILNPSCNVQYRSKTLRRAHIGAIEPLLSQHVVALLKLEVHWAVQYSVFTAFGKSIIRFVLNLY